jgi:hypothetical protein
MDGRFNSYRTGGLEIRRRLQACPTYFGSSKIRSSVAASTAFREYGIR